MAFYRRTFTHLFDQKAFHDVTRKLQAREETVQIALAEAINTAAAETKKLSAEEWDANMQIQSGYAAQRIHLIKRAKPGRLEAVVAARARATRADNFRYQVMTGRKGVRLNVRRGGSGGVIRNAFVIPRAKSNKKPLIVERLVPYHPSERRDFKHGGATVGRFGKAKTLRFKALYGPSVNQHFHDSRDRVSPKAMTSAKQQFMKAIGK